MRECLTHLRDGVVVVWFEALLLVQTLDPVETVGISPGHANLLEGRNNNKKR